MVNTTEVRQARIAFREALTVLKASASSDSKLSGKLAATEKPFSSLDELSDRLVVLFFALLQSRFELSEAAAASVRDKVFVALSPYVTGQTCIAGMFGAFCVIVRRSPLVFLTAEVRDALFIHHVAHASSSKLAFTSVIEALQSLLLTHNDLAGTVAVFGTAESRDRLFIPVVAVLTSDRKLGAESLFIAVVQMVITSPHFQTRAACDGVILPLAVTMPNHERAASWIYVMALFLESAGARAAFATARARHEFVRMAKHCTDPRCAEHYNQALHRITTDTAACRVFATSQVRDIFPRIAKNVTSSEGAGLLFRSMALLSDGDRGHTLFATKAIRDEVFIPLAKLATNDATAAVMLASLSLILGDEGEVEQVRLFATPALCDALLHPLEAISNSETSGIASAMLHQLTRGFDDGMEQRCALIAQRPAIFRILSRSATTERAVGLFLGPLFNVASQCPMQNHGGLLGDLTRLAGIVGTAATADMFLCALYAYFDRVCDSVNVTDEVRDKLVVALGSYVCSATGVRSFCDVVTIFLRSGAVGSLFRHDSVLHALHRMAEYATTADATVALALACRELDESPINEALVDESPATDGLLDASGITVAPEMSDSIALPVMGGFHRAWLWGMEAEPVVGRWTFGPCPAASTPRIARSRILFECGAVSLPCKDFFPSTCFVGGTYM